MINILGDDFNLRALSKLLEKSSGSSSRDALVQSANRFVHSASFFDIHYFLRVLALKRILLPRDVFVQLTRRIFHLSSNLTAMNSLQLMLHHTLSFPMPVALLRLLFSRVIPDLHVLNVRDLCRLLYVLTLPPLKFHTTGQEWFPVILQLLASKNPNWNHSFASINEVVSTIARGIFFCTEQRENDSMNAASLLINQSIKAWQILLEKPIKRDARSKEQNAFEQSLQIRETVFFLAACSYVSQHGIEVSSSRLKSISKYICNEIVLGHVNGAADYDNPLNEYLQREPIAMFQLNVNIIQDGNLLSKFILALSHYAEPFILKQMRMVFLDHHRKLRIQVDDDESVVLQATSIAMRIFRSMNIVGDRSTHDEEYDFLWEIVYGAVCRKTGLNVLYIAASCLWSDDLIRVDGMKRGEFPSMETGEHSNHMEATIALTLYMIISSYAFHETELGNPALLDMICSVVQYQKSQCLLYNNLSRGGTESIEQIQEITPSFSSPEGKCEMEALIHQIFAVSQDLNTMFRLIAVSPYIIQDTLIEKRLFYALNLKRRNFSRSLAQRICQFMLSNPSLTIHRWSFQAIALIFDILQFHYTHAKSVRIEDVHDISKLIHYVISIDFSTGAQVNSSSNPGKGISPDLPIRLHNAISLLCFVLCGHLCHTLKSFSLSKSECLHEQATAHLWQYIISVFQDTRIKLPKHMRNYLTSALGMIE
ncbi:hypothetical protein XU18_0329 [Perkinsela sp. CCAP 1560/4]|nr:hypothetical protein XU18_0329 [Perkinsela sp. CCAP 1560/4]|eukprot:KNH09644.1 hypothetical protein XU18_0329 [Perkinsela sp. CCAP 1560/4]